MQEIDVNMLREAEAELNGFTLPDDIMTFYYDKTRNVRKFYIKESGVNATNVQELSDKLKTATPLQMNKQENKWSPLCYNHLFPKTPGGFAEGAPTEVAINCIENTQMSRSYKMPLLLAFYNEGNIKFKLSQREICESFMSFYNNGANGIDLLQDTAGQNYKNWTSSSYLKIAKNPQDAFLNAASDFFYRDGEYFCLSDDLQECKDNEWFITNFKDVIEYKTRNYYKTRLFEKYSKEKIEIKYALRDERVNIFAMTQGGLPGKYPNQIFICKKELIPENRKIFLLDPKRTAANYSLSEVGKRYAKRIESMEYDYSYVGIVESQIKVRINEEVFKSLYEKDLFALWEPEAPYKYFEGKDEGYLVLFRVYKISDSVDEEVLDKGRDIKECFYGVSGVVESRLVRPVVSDGVFDKMIKIIFDLFKY